MTTILPDNFDEITIIAGDWTMKYQLTKATVITPPSPPIEIKPYSQNDPRWKNEIYAGGSTFGQAGCFVVSVAMIVSLNLPDETPVDVAANLRNAGCFTGNMLDNLSRVSYAYSFLKWGGFIHWRDKAANLGGIAEEIAMHGATILEVKFNPLLDGIDNFPKTNQHFVVAIEVRGEDVKIIDPWDGNYHDLKESRYAKPKSWTAKRAIQGIRLVRSVAG